MKILCIPYTHIISHISRPLLIAKELRNRGHEIFFAGESMKKKFIEQEGFTVFPLYETDPVELLGNIRKGRLNFLEDKEIEKMINADIILYERIKPDLVLTDFRFTAPISTQLAGLRHAAIVNASSTQYRACPFIPFFGWLPGWLVKKNAGMTNALDKINLQLEMFIFDNVMNIFKKLSKKYDLKKTITATNCLTGNDITLLADIPQYFPTRNLPSTYHYIGPLTWQSNLPPPSWWPPKNDKPLIYITMGTTGLADFFPSVHELFKRSDMRAIITTGAQAQGLETIDEQIYVESFMDGDLAIKASDLVVCHGGNGTIYQALQHGKPVIGIPTVPDQQYNMRRVEALGIGKTLSWKAFAKNPSGLLNIALSILEDQSFYQQARRIGDIIRTCNAPETAADIIERLMLK